MFSQALKTIQGGNINANYSVSPSVISTAGPWKIYDAKKKSTGKACSVFVFERRSLDAHGASGLGRSGAADVKRLALEVMERLKKEASSLAKLRHPSILELVEPVEETRTGLQFATEPVTASLASLLRDKDDQERSGGVGGRASRYVSEDADGTRRRREMEVDELEIQKGLLQISKALEFLHENAGLVHSNLTPDAILVNAKGDWKISGLAYCSPAENSSKPSSIQPMSLHEVLNPDPRLPRSVQLDLDYTSPDFVLDNNLTASADMFSLGLVCVALYNSPHRSPLESHASISTYKRIFQSSSTVPSSGNGFLCSRPIPKHLSNSVLPRLITRRPAQRMTAKDFQESEYFDNILVSTIRFMDAFPAKTASEKTQFLRGLIKVLPSFPKSVMEKKILPALLEEMKDKDLISLILHNVFKIIDLLPSGRRAFGDKIRPSLKEIFVINAKQAQEKDSNRDAGLMIILEHLSVITANCNGKEFKDDILPIYFAALESPIPTVVGAALQSIPSVLAALDYSTIRNELFPVVAMIFSRTNSLAIKVRGLQAFVILCGGSNDTSDDGLDGLPSNRASTSSALDKYTMQEKIVPLVKVIKTKEPAVMMAALNVLRIVGQAADADFVAMEMLPILWSMSLGPLLDLKQFQDFMQLIKTLSGRVEEEQTKKLHETGAGSASTAFPNDDFLSFGPVAGASFDANGATEDDFESLVKGKDSGRASSNPLDAGWDDLAAPKVTRPNARSVSSTMTPTFSWSTPTSTTTTPTPTPSGASTGLGALKPQQPSSFRTVTPDLARFESLTPSTTQFSQPLQPTHAQSAFAPPPPAQQSTMATSSVSWSTATANPWSSQAATTTTTTNTATSSSPAPMSLGGLSLGHRPGTGPPSLSSFSLPPPPGATNPSSSAFSMPPPANNHASTLGTASGGSGMGMAMNINMNTNTNTNTNMAGNRYSGANSIKAMSMSGQTASSLSLNSMSMNSMKGTSTGMGMGMGMGMQFQQQQQQQQQQQPQPQAQAQQQGNGLDKYQSLL